MSNQFLRRTRSEQSAEDAHKRLSGFSKEVDNCEAPRPAQRKGAQPSAKPRGRSSPEVKVTVPEPLCHKHSLVLTTLTPRSPIAQSTLSASLYQPPHHCLTLPLSIPLCASLSVSLALSVSLTPTLTLWSCQGLDDTDDDTPFRHIKGMAKPQKVPLSPPISFPWLTLVVGLCRSPRQSSNSGTTHSIYLSVCLHSHTHYPCTCTCQQDSRPQALSSC